MTSRPDLATSRAAAERSVAAARPQPGRSGSPARRRLLAAGVLAAPLVALGALSAAPAFASASRAAGAANVASVAHRAASGASGASGTSPGSYSKQSALQSKDEARQSGDPVQPIDTHPSSAQLSEGRTLFEENCSSCHGAEAKGSNLAPNLQGLGPGVPYLWMSNGWMPLAVPTSQPINKPPLFTKQQMVDIAEWVGTRKPGGQPIWSVDLSHASLSSGLDLFALNCAPCHTITGAGDALSDGNFAPSLHGVSATQVAEAVRQGPGEMPPFGQFQISNKQLADIAAYVTQEIQHPESPGGASLGGVGPVAEGFIGLFIGVGACILAAMWIGERNDDSDEDGKQAGHGAGTHAAAGAGDGDGHGPNLPGGTTVGAEQ